MWLVGVAMESRMCSNFPKTNWMVLVEEASNYGFDK